MRYLSSENRRLAEQFRSLARMVVREGEIVDRLTEESYRDVFNRARERKDPVAVEIFLELMDQTFPHLRAKLKYCVMCNYPFLPRRRHDAKFCCTAHRQQWNLTSEARKKRNKRARERYASEPYKEPLLRRAS